MMRDVPASYESRPIAIVGAGAAGLAAAIHAGGERRAGGGARGDQRRRPQDPDQRRRALQRPAAGARAGPLRQRGPGARSSATCSDRGRSPSSTAFFEDEVGVPLALEAESRKLFPGLEPRPRRARRPRRAGPPPRRHLRFDARVTGLAPASTAAGRWRSTAADAIDARRRGDGHRRLLGAADRQRRRRPRPAARTRPRVHAPYAALTPLTATPAVHAGLSGVSLPVTLRVAGTQGVGVRRLPVHAPRLQRPRRPGRLALTRSAPRPPAGRSRSWPVERALDDAAWHATLQGGDGLVVSRLRARCRSGWRSSSSPKPGSTPTSASPRCGGSSASRCRALCRYPLPWTGDEGFRKAEVTGGGVALDGVDPRTMECRRHPGLFLCGELLDAFGPIGGHNFAWAWATGRLAGRGTLRDRCTYSDYDGPGRVECCGCIRAQAPGATGDRGETRHGSDGLSEAAVHRHHRVDR